MKTIDITPIENKKVIDVFNEVKILRNMKHVNNLDYLSDTLERTQHFEL